MIFQHVVSAVGFVIFALLSREFYGRWRSDKTQTLATRAVFFASSLFALSNLMSLVSSFVWPTVVPVLWTRISTSISLLTAYWWVSFATDFFPSRRILRSLALCVTSALITITALEAPAISVRNGHIFFAHIHNPIPYLLYVHTLIWYLLVVYAGLSLTFIFSATQNTVRRVRTRLLFLAGGFGVLGAAIALIPILLLTKISPTTLEAYVNVLRILGLLSAPLIYWGLTDRGD